MTRKTKHRKSTRYRGTKCLNCDHPLDRSDRFCPYCSQENSDKQLSFSDYIMEFVGSILVYDSRLRYTLREILFKPGLISKNYIAGKRMKYANPFRFFLSVSIIYFLLKGLLTPSDIPQQTAIEYDLNYTVFVTDSVTPQDSDSSAIKRPEVLPSYSEAALDSLSLLSENIDRGKLYLQYHILYPTENAEEALTHLNHELTFKNKWLYKRIIAFNHISKNQKSFVDSITTNMPFFLFFFTPFMALFLRLFYPKRINYIEHLIFLFFTFSFFFLAKIPLLLLKTVIHTDFFDNLFLILIVPAYFFMALRRFYQQSFWKTTMKFILLGGVFLIGYTISIILYILGFAAIY